MSEESVRVVYKGVVQGVGFRFIARSIAKRYKIRGWARNLTNGDVELIAQGLQPDINCFLNALRNEFKSNISDVDINSVSMLEDFREFQIRF